jgi:hypothetical protein
MDALPNDIVRKLCDALAGEPAALAALSATTRATRDAATVVLAGVATRWAGWMRRAAAPIPREANRAWARSLDADVARLALNDANEMTTVRFLPTLQRKWVHVRGEQLGLTTTTVHRRSGNIGDVMMAKPQGWRLDLDGTPRPTRRPTRRHRHCDIDEWMGECECCGTELDAYDAMFHYSGIGPVCHDCIDEDPYMEGLKWEAKAYFYS